MILHLDGDSFFVACELAHRPDLRGKPVIVGEDKGIACAMSMEAKKLGIYRAMPVFKARKLVPELVVLPNNFKLYRLYSRRMVSILKRFTPHVEAYSIDECFADLTGCDSMLGMSYEAIAQKIKQTLFDELGMTFSVGLSVNKLLAKTASKWNKPNGFKIISKDEILPSLSEVPIAKIWGMGRKISAYCIGLGLQTAGDFASKSEGYINAHFSKPQYEMWLEMNGEQIFGIHDGPREPQKSFMDTCTFRPPTTDKRFLIRELSKHAENVCRHMRRYGLCALQGSFFLRKQDLRYSGMEIRFEHPTASAGAVIAQIEKAIDTLYVPGVLYRATGVTLFHVVPEHYVQDDLFNSRVQNKIFDQIETYIDRSIRSRFGNKSVVLGSSLTKSDSRYIPSSTPKGLYVLRKVY